MQPLTEQDERDMLAIQARADSAYIAADRRAPPPLPYERKEQYRLRLIDGVKALSPKWRKADISLLPGEAMAVAEQQIYADVAVYGPTAGLAPSQIKEVIKKSGGGHTVIEFRGGENAHFTQQFSREPRVGIFRTPEAYAAMSRDTQVARVSEIVRTLRPPLSAPRAAF